VEQTTGISESGAAGQARPTNGSLSSGAQGCQQRQSRPLKRIGANLNDTKPDERKTNGQEAARRRVNHGTELYNIIQ
jgi:ribosomal protein S9